MFTLDQARAFVAVAEELHFGRAADRLHMTQPPLSRQIQKLERALGVVLLLRESRGVRLTEAGRAFLDECRHLVTKAEQAPRQARLIAAGEVGLLRLGYTAGSAFSILGPLVASIREELPGVAVELDEMVTARQLGDLRSGRIDIGLARPPFDADEVESTLLLTEALMVAVPGDHPLALRDAPISSSELRGEPLIMHSPEQARYFRDLVTGLMDVRDDQISHTSSQVLTMVALVAAGQGLALVPESARRLGMAGVNILPLRESPVDLVQLHAVWRGDSTNPALSTVLPLVRRLGEQAAKG
ncbi:LysR family transcriptional regulator [Nesterenkonia flava]|uniref:LysR family transcriptional regulator n=1 Tax=Nesterenkonia flava TaxID=469799 RepID=A0ABU1FSW3_9MICC|nr:LysR family transcriptional regulator [Nesterenkonia flava]MDR5711751.1 LysR family transcriptional regulator [Nesterenkonia flava]